jgi:hypothetical protein
MRTLRLLSMAILLTLMLGTGSLAGTIECPPAPAPPPESQLATGTGIIGTSPSGAEPIVPATDPVVDVVLDLLQSVLSLF